MCRACGHRPVLLCRDVLQRPEEAWEEGIQATPGALEFRRLGVARLPPPPPRVLWRQEDRRPAGLCEAVGSVSPRRTVC